MRQPRRREAGSLGAGSDEVERLDPFQNVLSVRLEKKKRGKGTKGNKVISKTAKPPSKMVFLQSSLLAMVGI